MRGGFQGGFIMKKQHTPKPITPDEREAMAKERGNIQLHFEKGQTIPVAGDKMRAWGFAGEYEISIHRIKKTFLHDDGSVSIAVNATKRLVEPVEQVGALRTGVR
jgi:hypothetical protein